jgi:hypothetical protein
MRNLKPIAIMLQLLRPARPGWGLLGDDWLAPPSWSRFCVSRHLADIPRPQIDVRFWPKADMSLCAAHVRFRGYSRHAIRGMSAIAVAIGGKADMACCSAYVCF